jgi:hypothetical protein
MNPLERFFAYARDFELTYLDDDWTRLAKYFAADAVYRVEGAGTFDCVLEGRDAIFQGIRRFLDNFDRQCRREIRLVGTPSVEGDTVRFHGDALYRRGESPVLLLSIEEAVEFRDGVIVSLTDRYRAPFDAEMHDWMDRWGEGLSPAYV